MKWMSWMKWTTILMMIYRQSEYLVPPTQANIIYANETDVLFINQENNPSNSTELPHNK